MTALEILAQLEAFGDANTKKTLMKHGAQEPFFGVKIADMKKILQKTKKNHELSLELYKTGNSDAMYLAGLMADEKKIRPEHLEEWLDQAYWYYLSEFTVPWVASETDFGFELGLKWIGSNDERTAAAGWATLAAFASVHRDEDLDLAAYGKLLVSIENNIHGAPNRVKLNMNRFVISIGTYIKDLNAQAMETANRIGAVKVDMNGTACQVPLAVDYIQKVLDKGGLGKKRATARC